MGCKGGNDDIFGCLISKYKVDLWYYEWNWQQYVGTTIKIISYNSKRWWIQICFCFWDIWFNKEWKAGATLNINEILIENNSMPKIPYYCPLCAWMRQFLLEMMIVQLYFIKAIKLMEVIDEALAQLNSQEQILVLE